jgi:lipopolysaccharide export system permease protein
MKILHRHIFLSLLIALVSTLLVFTFIILFGNIFKDLLELLSNRSVTLLNIAEFFVLILPYVLSFSMPMALLAATLLVVGRISADHELTAARACGISFFEVMLPIFGISAVLSFMCLFINSTVAPRAKYKFNQAFVGIIFKYPISLFEEEQFKNFGDLNVYVGEKNAADNMLYRIRIRRPDDKFHQYIYAESGQVLSDPEQLKIKITLRNGYVNQLNPSEPENFSENKRGMSFEQYPIELDLTKLIDVKRAKKDDNHRTSMELWREAEELKKRGGGNPTPKLVEIQKRIALSMACISFVLIGIPLGIQVQRRETSIGILVSLAVTVAYYFLVILAESLKQSPHMYPELIVWMPNLVFQGVGIYLIRKQQRI